MQLPFPFEYQKKAHIEQDFYHLSLTGNNLLEKSICFCYWHEQII